VDDEGQRRSAFCAHDDLLDDGARDPLPDLGRTEGARPDVAEVRAEVAKRDAFVVRQAAAGRVELRDRARGNVDGAELLVPSRFELGGDESIASIDLIVLLERALRLDGSRNSAVPRSGNSAGPRRKGRA
jgi:hypothetical protein